MEGNSAGILDIIFLGMIGEFGDVAANCHDDPFYFPLSELPLTSSDFGFGVDAAIGC